MPGAADLLQRQLVVLRRCALAPQRFSALFTHAGCPASTLARTLRALVAAGLLRRDASGAYLAAPGATALAFDLLGRGRAPGAAAPALEALARETGASASYWQLDGRRLVLVAKREVTDGFRYLDRFAHQPPEGHPFGLLLLAARPAEERRGALRGAGAATLALLRRAEREPVLACVQPWAEPFWRVGAAVRCGGAVTGAVGVSRHARPDPRTAERDRRCVAAAAARLGADLDPG